MKNILILLVLCACLLNGQAQNKKNYYVKHLEFPQGSTLDQKVDIAARLVPSQQQLAWQQMELTAFLHFGINTFTGREWGDGTEDPALFNPTELDAEQWVRELKASGFKMVLLTAKHHDGFCLWPTRTTKHSVASSPWKGGKGDVVRELRNACDKYGMNFGVYLSPWDRNASCYGDSPAYNQFFIDQLTELLTNYGEVHEVWFDGANGEGPNGKKQIYDWDLFYKTIQKLQPKAVMAIMGDDVRWVGNEKGIGRETEWSATVLTPGIYGRSSENNKRLGVFGKAKDLGSRAMLEHATELFWYPSEVDVSIRPGWFYHAEEDSKVKSLKHLNDIYFQSVGYNSVLLLNIPPDRRGRIHEADIDRLKEFAAYRQQTFAVNYVSKGMKHWQAKSGTERIYSLEKGAEINVVLLQEDIARGQRVEAFEVEALTPEGWKSLGQGTTIGHKRLLRFERTKASKLRVKIESCRLTANISNVAAYYAAPLRETSQNDTWRVDPFRKEWKQLSVSPLVLDLGKEVMLNGFVYAPANEKATPTMAFHYKLFGSIDGMKWIEIPTNGEFSNIMHNPLPQTVMFREKLRVRFVKLEATTPEERPAKVGMQEIGLFVQPLLPQDDERLVYQEPGAPLRVKPGEVHPGVKGWKFFTAHEFLDRDTAHGLPLGFMEHRGAHMSRTARVSNKECSKVTNGALHIWSVEEPDSVDNFFGQKVKYSHGCYRSPKPGDKEFWCRFTENMRIEIRFKRTDTQGFNDALWFMGNNNRPWPKNGEIDLLENPKKTVNQQAHFTLHSENYYAGVVGGAGSVTASTQLADMTQWNIYWMEWYPDRIVGGVNGQAYFEHRKGANGNTDWPWSDPEGFFLIFSTGISVNPNAWPGAIVPSEWKAETPPSMFIDWIRVYVNDSYIGEKAPSAKFY